MNDKPAGFGPVEAQYLLATPREHRKRLGQFFTPPAIADVLCEWTAEIQPQSALDPAVGSGALVRRLLELAPACRMTALDVDAQVLRACRLGLQSDQERVDLLRRDFLAWESDDEFDAIVANPPYLRHHDLEYSEDLYASIEARSGVRLSRLSNAYALFLLEICRRLRPGGRAAVITPGEWLNANFGGPLKEFLIQGGFIHQLIHYSHSRSVFDDALTTACVLLLRKPTSPGPSAKIATIFVPSGATADSPEVVRRTFDATRLLEQPKWTWMIQHGAETARPAWVPLREFALTRRGIATGANRFFHLTATAFAAAGLPERSRSRCIGKAATIRGLVFDAEDYDALRDGDGPCYLVRLPRATEQLCGAETRYVQQGEEQGLPRRYLLSQRSPWWTMERRPPAPILAAVFARETLRFVWNRAGAENLTAFHCVYPQLETPDHTAALVACLNATRVRRSAQSNQRVYGGGLSKLEPRDLLDIHVPDVRGLRQDTCRDLQARLLDLDLAVKTGADPSAAQQMLDAAVDAL